MNHRANIGLIDTHAERICGDNRIDSPIMKLVLDLALLFRC